MKLSYKCSECGRAVGLFLDSAGSPRQFRCPHTGRLANIQVPVHRDTAPLTSVARENVLQQLRMRGFKE